MKKILFVSSEAVPYVKTGGLADVVGSLPKYFDKKEYDVRVVIPKYACMDRSFLPNLKFLCHFYVNLNWRRQYVGIFESEYHGVHFYFVDNEFYFAGESPYNNIYEDVEKFAYFSKAVLASLPYIHNYLRTLQSYAVQYFHLASRFLQIVQTHDFLLEEFPHQKSVPVSR